jgi:hypothetical protein
MSLLPCIYCKRIDVPRTCEHVLQCAFDATAVLENEVCGECNAAFSTIDKDFVDAVNFFYLGKNMLRSLGLGSASSDNGLTLRTKLRSDGLAEHFPQLYERAPDEWSMMHASPAEQQAMIAELAEPKRLRVAASVVKNDDGSRPGLCVIRSRARTYLVEGTDPIRVAELEARLREHGLKVETVGEPRLVHAGGEDKPTLTFQKNLPIDRFSRAIAKIALNFVAHRLGAATALQRTFDALREFARHGTGGFLPFVTPSILAGGCDEPVPWVLDGQHALVLMRTHIDGLPREAVFVIIGGKLIATTTLQPKGTLGEGLADGTWLVSRCTPSQRRWEDFTMPRDAFRAIVNPAALGLEAEWRAITSQWTADVR